MAQHRQDDMGPPQSGGGPYGQPQQEQQEQQAPLMNGRDNSGGYKSMKATDPHNIAFFIAACCTMVGSILTFIAMIISLMPFEAMEMAYMFLFGLVLAVLDTPFFEKIPLIRDQRMYISKYFNILTRCTGKGLVFLFLGCNTLSAMYANTSSMFLLILAFLLNLVVIFVGIFAIGMGIMRTFKLKKSRDVLKDGHVIETRLGNYARTFPAQQNNPGATCLTHQEFNALTRDNGGFTWTATELQLIFNALVSNPEWRQAHQNRMQTGNNRMEEAKISADDLSKWVSGGVVLL